MLFLRENTHQQGLAEWHKWPPQRPCPIRKNTNISNDVANHKKEKTVKPIKPKIKPEPFQNGLQANLLKVHKSLLQLHMT
jgi:hypothetical protein